MPEAWQRGYDWANGEGLHTGLDIDYAIEAWGYDLDSPEAEQFTNGALQAQQEDLDCDFTGEEWAE